MARQEIDLALTLLSERPPAGFQTLLLLRLPLMLIVPRKSRWQSADDLWKLDRIDEPLITLPAYAPELNAMENVWQFLRQNRLGAQVWKTYNDIVRACSDAWNWFVSDAPRIASIAAHE